MKIKYKEKPSKEIIEKFCSKIEEFLSLHQLKIKVEILDSPRGPLKLFINHTETEEIYLWIKKISITTPYTNEELEIGFFELGFPEKITNRWIWLYAHQIQNILYSYLKKDPGNPKDNDPYWKLWDVYPNKIKQKRR